MEAPAEKYAYCLMLSPDFSQWLVRLFVGAVAAVWSRVPCERRCTDHPWSSVLAIYVMDTRRKTIT